MSITFERSSLSHLRAMIERDISSRALRTGDRYLTSEQVGQLLGVSAMTASRAMKELADDRVLVRRRRAGTFVGPNARMQAPRSVNVVHVLVPEWLYRSFSHLGAIMSGLRKHLVGVQVQFNFLSENDGVALARQLTENAAEHGDTVGFVLVGVQRAVCQFFEEQHIPTVVSGHVHPGVKLPWVDRDQEQVGRLLTRHFLEAGHRRIGILTRDVWWPGDNLFMRGVSHEIERFKSDRCCLSISTTPTDLEFVDGVFREMLSRNPAPTAFICMTDWIGDRVLAVSSDLHADIGIGLRAISGNSPPTDSRVVAAYHDPELLGEHIGRLLSQMVGGKDPTPHHYELPTTLALPISTKTGKGSKK